MALACALAWCVTGGATASAESAAPAHRARLSADLADHLAAGSQSIKVIVHGSKGEVDAVAGRYNLRVARYLRSGGVLDVTAGQLAALRDDEAMDHLSGDIAIRSSVDEVNLEAIGVDQVWAGAGDVPALTGKGVTVAVIDSGIDARHNAVRKRVLFTKDFTGGDGSDRFGHGTHVAAIIAGQGGKTADTQAYRGVAPGAYLLNLRVLGDDGSGTASDVIEAIDWTIEHAREFNVRVINLSLGAPVLQPYRDDPLCEAVERAVRAGITVVAAAGNFGKTKDGVSVYGGITTPANSPFAIAVGAIDTHGTAARSDDTLATYSSKGPTRYDLIVKPDLAAPGSHIQSAEAADSFLAKTYPQAHVSGSGANAVMQLSGTSMAAGVISGAVALLVDEQVLMAPTRVRAALLAGSSFMPTVGLIGAGAGAVNVFGSVRVVADGFSRAFTESSPIEQLLLSVRARRPANRLITSSSKGLLALSIVWGAYNAPKVLGSYDGDSIVWGSNDGDSIVWGAADGDSIVWGTADGDSIVWGSAEAEPFVARSTVEEH